MKLISEGSSRNAPQRQREWSWRLKNGHPFFVYDVPLTIIGYPTLIALGLISRPVSSINATELNTSEFFCNAIEDETQIPKTEEEQIMDIINQAPPSLVPVLTEYLELFRELSSTPANVEPIRLILDQSKVIAGPPRRISAAQLMWLRAGITRLLDSGIIRQSNSEYASPIVLARKGESWRLCVDYRRLNELIVRPAYPLPLPDHLRSVLAGKCYFCKLDLKSGFMQVPLAEESVRFTAFTTPFGLFEFTRLPFGLTNSPPDFQAALDRTLADLRFFACVLYVDDILVFGETEAELVLWYVG